MVTSAKVRFAKRSWLSFFQRLMVIFFRGGRIKVIRSFINGMNSYISAIGRLKMKNIVKGEMDPRVEFGLQK